MGITGQKTTIATFVAKVAIASSKTQRASWRQRTSRHSAPSGLYAG